MSQLELIFTLLIAFQVKQFVADFPLQREYMMRKVRPGWDFLVPLATHCLVHAFGTLLIICIFAPALWYLCLFDFIVHFVQDRIKSGPRYLGRYNDPKRHSFWNVLGYDQMVHHLTHYFIIYQIMLSLQ